MNDSVADPGGAEGGMAPPAPVKISHKKMAAKFGRIDFMFLGPHLPGLWIRYWNLLNFSETPINLNSEQ